MVAVILGCRRINRAPSGSSRSPTYYQTQPTIGPACQPATPPPPRPTRWSPACQPAILALLGDGVPRAKGTIVAALAERHPKDEVVRTLMRLAVTGHLAEEGRRYVLGPDQG